MKQKFLFLFILIACCSSAKERSEAANVQPNTVNPVVNWNKVAGQLTAVHWGLNNQNAQGFTPSNQELAYQGLANYFRLVQPGVIRIMKNITTAWFSGNSWDRKTVRTELDNAQHSHVNQHAKRIMLCLYAPPPFINSGKLPLANEAQEDSLAAFFAQLPLLIKSVGYHINLYEFFNEKEPAYGALGGNSGNLSGTDAGLPAYIYPGLCQVFRQIHSGVSTAGHQNSTYPSAKRYHEIQSISLLGIEGDLPFEQKDDALYVSLPPDLPCDYAVCLKIIPKLNPAPASLTLTGF
jgi:hypothetical protein